jgi:hypothetical protein
MAICLKWFETMVFVSYFETLITVIRVKIFKSKHKMYRKSAKLKKTLTKDRVLEVLEIAGLSSEPLSSYQIATLWGEKFSTDRNAEPNIKYIYEVIRRLFRPGETSHPERFLSISYKRKVQEEVFALEKKYNFWQLKPGEIRSITSADPNYTRVVRAGSRIDELKTNRRNWRYGLNLKGLLLYLVLADEYGRDKRIIHKVFTNVSNSNIGIIDLHFLQHFNVFEKLYNVKTLVEILTQIAIELKDMISRMTPKFLKNYILTRCYEEITIDISINNNFFLKAMKQVNEGKLEELHNYKVKVLHELIPIERERLEEMEEELKVEKVSLA